MGKPDEEFLHRYFDDELAPDERLLSEEKLTPEDRLRLAALGDLRSLIAGSLEADARDFDVWPAIDRELRKSSLRRWRTRLRGHVASTSAGVVMAALATFVLLLRPWAETPMSNGCDVESLEVEGAMATVLQVHDPRIAQHRDGDATTTIIWSED